MFHQIPAPVMDRMNFLEELDAKERQLGLPREKRLRQIPPETGKFLAILAAASPKGAWIEIGTSGGYSALWLSLACSLRKTRLITYELLDEKSAIARETFSRARVTRSVSLVVGDARVELKRMKNISFCFLDAEKEIYGECYDIVVPKMVRGGLLVADNVISHKEQLQPFVDKVLVDARVDAVVVPIGKGELVAGKL